MRTLHVGIASLRADEGADTCNRFAANISRRPVSRRFGSLRPSFARVLSDKNRALLAIIAESAPESLACLAELTGRKKSNLSRTLKTVEQDGLVQLSHGARGSVIPTIPYQSISLPLPLSKPGSKGPKPHARVGLLVNRRCGPRFTAGARRFAQGKPIRLLTIEDLL
jgi:predicted transcriptional regulator